VRGAFHDPETGSYALKRYQGDRRGKEGHHREIRLLSLHPDKARYPDILLKPEGEHDIAVIAELIEILEEEQFARIPRRKGQRDLVSVEGKQRAEQRLSLHHSAFFGGQPQESKEGEESEEEAAFGDASYLCMDEESGGLYVEIAAQPSLLPLVELISFCTEGGQERTLLANNLRHHKQRFKVLPSWGGSGCRVRSLTDGSDLGLWPPAILERLEAPLQKCTLAGLSTSEVTIFRVDALGIGRIILGKRLSFGQRYRLLLPLEKAKATRKEMGVHLFSDGWGLWELTPEELTSKEIELLQQWGLTLNEKGAHLRWACPPPQAYRSNPKGERYPCFSTSTTPCIQIEGLAEEEDELFLLLSSGGETELLSLPPEENWIVEMAGLREGRYLVQLSHAETRFSPQYLAFSIEKDAEEIRLLSSDIFLLRVPLAHLSRREMEAVLHEKRMEDLATDAETTTICADQQGFIHWSGDLGEEMEKARLTLKAPPFWSWRCELDLGRRQTYRRLQSDEQGLLDLSSVLKDLGEEVTQSTMADIRLDGGELGILYIQHQRNQERLPSLLFAWYDEHSSLLDLDIFQEDLQLAFTKWLRPLLEQLGYLVYELSADERSESPTGHLALLLKSRHRTAHGLEQKAQKIAIFTNPCRRTESEEALKRNDVGSARHYADTLCQRYGVDSAIVTNGLFWLHHRKKVTYHQSFDLFDIFQNKSQEQLGGFLGLFLAPF
jgi:hypothetical protein